MTTPSSSYYEAIIRENPKYAVKYLAHRWLPFYRASRIRSFTWTRSGDIFSYRKGCLTFQQAPVNPAWQVPDSYFQPVAIPLNARREAAIAKTLAAIPFSRLKTSACSFVNLMGGHMITEDLTCRFPLGFTYRFAAKRFCQELDPLYRLLTQIAGNSPDYQQICHMETWLFTEQRWDQLQEKS